MKKLYSFIALLLLFVMLLTSCTMVSDPNNGTDKDDSSDSDDDKKNDKDDDTADKDDGNTHDGNTDDGNTDDDNTDDDNTDDDNTDDGNTDDGNTDDDNTDDDNTDDGNTDDGNTDDDNTGKDEPVVLPDNFIYNFESEFYIVYDSTKTSTVRIEELIYLFVNESIYPRPIDVSAETYDGAMYEHELVIGETPREISATAYQYLERNDKNGDEITRYCIYSNGSSIAIAFDADYGDFTLDASLDLFSEKYICEQLCLAKGIAENASFNLYDKLLEDDTKYYENAWNNLRTKLGEGSDGIIKALQSYYGLYEGEKIVLWLANLYDNNICVCKSIDGKLECEKTVFCGTGGFYYSNSARDNAGFLPDAESIAQALSIIGNCGISYGLPGGGYSAVLPDWMAKQICDYIYNMQESDGFFYHPQWGKDITLSRRGRDLGWCDGILDTYGVGKKYTSASSSSFEYNTESGMTERLGASAVKAVSKVINTASVAVAPHLETPEAFAQYLEDLDIYNNSYSAGNTLSAQGSQIKARGQEYGDILINKLNEVYNYYGNGTWHHTVNYYAINGVMKISGSYARWKTEIPDGERTCIAAFEAIGSNEAVKDVVDIWNPWVAVNNVLDNIRSYAANGTEKAEQLRLGFYDEFIDAIIHTRDKLALFKKLDGSFSYQQDHSSSTSQGSNVAVPGSNEGDINATVIATNNFTYEIFQILGVSRIPFCKTKDRLVFLNAVESLAPIVKQGGASSIGDPIDFDWDDLGEAPYDVAVSENPDIVVVEDKREGSDGNQLLNVTSKKGKSDYLTVNSTGATMGATCQVFTGDFCFEKFANSNQLFRIEMGQGGDNINVYRLELCASKGKITFWDNSSRDQNPKIRNNLGITVNTGEWFNLRLEYYTGTHDTVRLKIYINNELATVVDNYYDYKGVKVTEGVGVPGNKLKNVRLYMLKDADVSFLCDNLHCYNTRDSYKPENLAEKYKNNKNVDYRELIEFGSDVGKRVPVMDLPYTLDSEETVNTEDYLNKIVVVNFWGIWSATSKEMLPELNRIAEDYGEDVAVLAIHSTHNKGFGHVYNNCKDYSINFLDDTRAEGALIDDYFAAVGGTSDDDYPRTLILNGDGVIIHAQNGTMTYDELKEIIDKELAD